MIKTKNIKLGLNMYILSPGEYYSSNENCIIKTIAGSCIVICFYEPDISYGAMGHFMIPGALGTEGLFRDEIAEHGIQHIELIMADVVKNGGDRKKLEAKIFGAAFLENKKADNTVLNANVEFIHRYLETEGIQLTGEDLGQTYRREIMLNPNTGEVFRKVLKKNETSSEFVNLEREYIDYIFKHKHINSKVILFD